MPDITWVNQAIGGLILAVHADGPPGSGLKPGHNPIFGKCDACVQLRSAIRAVLGGDDG